MNLKILAQCPAYAGPILFPCVVRWMRAATIPANPNTLRQAHLRAGYSSICRPLLILRWAGSAGILAMFSLLGVITAVLLYLVMFNVQTDSAHTRELLQHTLLKVFYFNDELLPGLLSGSWCWPMKAGRWPKMNPNGKPLLLEEISATALRICNYKAKEQAEAANSIKAAI